jgi:hypothetical protein
MLKLPNASEPHLDMIIPTRPHTIWHELINCEGNLTLKQMKETYLATC